MVHSVINCYHKIDHSYEGRIPTKKLAVMVAATNARSSDQTWFIDSGASTHIISDLANLSLQNEYRGTDQVAIGNGAGLPIAHVGSSTFSHNSSNFHLKNILHCPSVSTNLLSVH